MSRFLLLAFLSLGVLCFESAATEPRPNLLIVIADDLCWRDLGYEGNGEVKTPHLDALCAQSMHLTRMFTPATTCSPSRHALYTGLVRRFASVCALAKAARAYASGSLARSRARSAPLSFSGHTGEFAAPPGRQRPCSP